MNSNNTFNSLAFFFNNCHKGRQFLYLPSFYQNFSCLAFLFFLATFSACCIDGDCEEEDMLDEVDVFTTINAVRKCGEITENETWTDQGAGVDYIVDCDLIIDGARLSIRENVIVQLENDALIRVINDGALKADGKEGETIRFQGKQGEDFSWSGILIESDNLYNELDYVILEGAGSRNFGGLDFPDGKAAIKIDGNIWITNSIIQDIDGHGLYVGKNSSETPQVKKTRFSDNTFSNCNGHPVLMVKDFLKIFDTDLATCVYRDNTLQSIGLTSNAYNVYMTGSHGWQNPGIPFHIYYAVELEVGARLTILEGTEFIMADGSWIGFTNTQLNESGMIRVVGEAGDKVLFRSENGERGSWGGFHFNSPHESNLLQHVEIRDAGYNYFGTGVAVEIHNAFIGANLTMEDVVIKNSDCGIRMGTGAVLTASLGDVLYENVNSETCE